VKSNEVLIAKKPGAICIELYVLIKPSVWGEQLIYKRG